MKITILYGDPLQGNVEFTSYLQKLEEGLQQNNQVRLFCIHEMDVRSCMGCWSCWWKTPGVCAIKDDAADNFKAFIQSDFIIFASPILAGFTSSTLKMITDRLIVLLHPYFKYTQGETHHRKRYDSYPDFGVLLQPERDTDAEDIQIIRNIYDRFAINFHSRQLFCNRIDQHQPGEIINEICNI